MFTTVTFEKAFQKSGEKRIAIIEIVKNRVYD